MLSDKCHYFYPATTTFIMKVKSCYKKRRPLHLRRDFRPNLYILFQKPSMLFTVIASSWQPLIIRQVRNHPNVVHRIPWSCTLAMGGIRLYEGAVAIMDDKGIFIQNRNAKALLGEKPIVINFRMRMIMGRIAGPTPGMIDYFA